MSNLVVYHANCFDGFAAAWIARQALGDNGLDTTFLPAKYGDGTPNVSGYNIYILDFSYPRIAMEVLAQHNKLVVLDHHKTAQANCEGLSFCTFDMTRSGAGLTWDYFHPHQSRPALINYIEDRDLWNWKLPNSREISACIASYPRTFDIYDMLDKALDHSMQETINEGRAILRFENQKVEEMCAEAKMVCFDGENTIPAVNVPYNFGSLCGEYLNKTYPDCKYSAYYFDRKDGEQQWGLRSTGYDVSEVAKKFGGGGHKQASGFVKGKVTR